MVFEADLARHQAERGRDRLAPWRPADFRRMLRRIEENMAGILAGKRDAAADRPDRFLEHQHALGHLAAAPAAARPSAKAAPIVGWPAKASSRAGVKMRTAAEWTPFLGESTKTVSERFNSAAIRCISAIEVVGIEDDGSGSPARLRVKTSRRT